MISDKKYTKIRPIGLIIAIACLFFASSASYSQTAILDTIATGYRNASANWLGALLASANRLFMLLATIELAWSFIVWALEKNEFQSFVAVVAKKIFQIGIFYALLLNGPVWIPAIIDSFTQIGVQASGAPNGGLSPSDVFSRGVDNAATMLAGIKTLKLIDDFATMIIGGIAALVIVAAFAIVAGQFLIALVESYFAITAGMIFLGFGGSRWTTDFVQKFIGYAVATGVKLFVLYLIIAVGNAQATTWKADLAAIANPGAPVFNIILSVLGGSLVYMYMTMQIPSLAASMLSGSPSLTAGGAAATAGVAAAGLVGGAAGAAATTLGATKAAGGMGSAISAAWGQAGAQGTSGVGRAVQTLGNFASAGATDTGNRIAEAIAPTKGGRMAGIAGARAAELSAAAAGSPAPASPGAPAAAAATAGPQPVPQSNSRPPAQTAPPGPSAAAGLSAGQAGPAAAPSATGAAPRGVNEAAPSSAVAPGIEDRLRDLQQVRPPQLPPDAAPPATVHLRFDHPQD